MATLLSDSFDRANSTSVIGSPQIGPAPVVQTGVGGITSNTLYPPTAPLNVTWDLGTPDVELSFLASNISSSVASVLFGYVGATDYYLVSFQGGTAVILYRQSVGGLAQLYSSSVKLPVSGTAVCKAHYKDGIIRAYVDDVLVFRWVLDTPITSHLHGIRLSSGVARADNLLGTDAPIISEPTLDGSDPNTAFVYTAASGVNSPSFAYRGADTKLQDISEGA